MNQCFYRVSMPLLGESSVSSWGAVPTVEGLWVRCPLPSVLILMGYVSGSFPISSCH